MGTKIVYHKLKSDKSLSEIRESVKRSLFMLGGTVNELGDSYQVIQGANGVSMAFTAQMEGYVTIRQSTDNTYDLMANVNWKPNALFWICLVVGFFVFGILWIIPLLYLFIDPTSAYQQVFFNVQNSVCLDLG